MNYIYRLILKEDDNFYIKARKIEPHEDQIYETEKMFKGIEKTLNNTVNRKVYKSSLLQPVIITPAIVQNYDLNDVCFLYCESKDITGARKLLIDAYIRYINKINDRYKEFTSKFEQRLNNLNELWNN